MPDIPIHVIGWDHHRCEVALRERLAVAYGELPDCLAQLTEQPGVEEAVVVSTCNRSEWYVAGDISIADVHAFVAQYVGVAEDEITNKSYHCTGNDAIRHLFRVVSSLESMVVGEYQIVHQVKQAYERSQQCRCVGPILHAPFQRALSVGKEVRNQTAIGAYKVSIASVAVDLAQHILGDLKRSRLLIIGAGEMADLTLTHLLEKGVHSVSIINRRKERAEQFIHQHPGLQGQEVETTIIDWSDLSKALAEHDMVLSSTAAPVPIINAEKLQGIRRTKPIMFIDLAVPRDVAADVAQLDNVYSYNLDNFDAVVARHQQLRGEDIEEAEELIRAAVDAFNQERQDADMFSQVSRFFDDLTDNEMSFAKKHLDKNGAQVADEDLHYVLSRVSKKIRHQIMQLLREMPDSPQMRELIRQLLNQRS